MGNEVNFSWRKEYWDIYGSFCKVKDIGANNSMEIVSGFNLNYPDATLLNVLFRPWILNYSIFIARYKILLHAIFDKICLGFFVELIYMRSALIKGT